MQFNDTTRVLLMAFITSTLNVISLAGLHLDTDLVAGLNLAIGNGVLLLFYIFKSGQQPPSGN